jgi:predicted chitinase
MDENVVVSGRKLMELCPSLRWDKRALLKLYLNQHMEKYEIITPLRAAFFFAFLLHESGKFGETEWSLEPEAAVEKACRQWKERGLNQVADRNEVPSSEEVCNTLILTKIAFGILQK